MKSAKDLRRKPEIFLLCKNSALMQAVLGIRGKSFLWYTEFNAADLEFYNFFFRLRSGLSSRQLRLGFLRLLLSRGRRYLTLTQNMCLDLNEVCNRDRIVAAGISGLSCRACQRRLLQNVGFHSNHIRNCDLTITIRIAGNHHRYFIHNLTIRDQLNHHSRTGQGGIANFLPTLQDLDVGFLYTILNLCNSSSGLDLADKVIFNCELVGCDFLGSQHTALVCNRMGGATAMITDSGLCAVLGFRCVPSLT